MCVNVVQWGGPLLQANNKRPRLLCLGPTCLVAPKRAASLAEATILPLHLHIDRPIP